MFSVPLWMDWLPRGQFAQCSAMAVSDVIAFHKNEAISHTNVRLMPVKEAT